VRLARLRAREERWCGGLLRREVRDVCGGRTAAVRVGAAAGRWYLVGDERLSEATDIRKVGETKPRRSLRSVGSFREKIPEQDGQMEDNNGINYRSRGLLREEIG
jgi:hypothetical protein